MKRESNEAISLKKYRRKSDFNVGVLIFAIIFIYIVVTIISYGTRTRIPTFEVRQGRILTDHSYVGIAIRQEQIVPMEASGYVYYFHNNLSKIRSGADIIAVSPIPIPFEEALAQYTNLQIPVVTNDNHPPFIYHTQNFMETVDLQRFTTVQAFRNDLTHSFRGSADQVRTAQIDEIVARTYGNAQVFPSPTDGILVMRLDGMEGITKDDITADVFLRGEYETTLFADEVRLNTGEPAYKLVTSESWYIVIQGDEEVTALLDEMIWARIRFIRDDVLAWVNPIVFNQGEERFIALSLNHSMIRYAEERFINIELILEDQTGLMIPRTAVTEMDFFRVPSHFVVPRYTAFGIMVVDEMGEEEFVLTRIYNTTPEGDIFINPNEIPSGTRLACPDTGELMTLNVTEPLQGVFNINHGYAVFRFINILTSNIDYYLVEEGNVFSVSNFDFIALMGDSIVDGEIVAR
jgi:hypothetical protein